jgi:integrase
VSEFRPFHVERWVDDYELAVTSRHNYFRSIKTCLKWAVKQGYIDASPIAAMEVPSPERREVYIPPDEFEAMLEYVSDPSLRDLMVTTYHTGCRPQESRRVTARYVEIDQARWVFPYTKSKGKKVPRVVYLDDTAYAITKRLLERSDGGPLFRNSKGKPWTKDAINCGIDRVRIRMGKVALEAAGKEPSEAEIAERIKTLEKTKCVNGRIPDRVNRIAYIASPGPWHINSSGIGGAGFRIRKSKRYRAPHPLNRNSRGVAQEI